MRWTVLCRVGGIAAALWSLAGAAPLLGQQQSAAAKHTDMSVAFRFGTTGVGGEIAKLLAPHVAVRVGGSYFSESVSKTQSNVAYNASLKVHTGSLLLDLFPASRGNFHVTVGAVTNPLSISATAQPTGGTYTLNGQSYTAAQVGTLSATGTFPSVGPYVGLGFGTPASSGGALKLLLDLGVVIGQPTISLTATGAAGNPQLASSLAAQQDTTQTDVRKYLKVYPVIALGLAYRF